MKAKRSSSNRPRGSRAPQRPSLFFIILLAIALVILAWGVVRIVQTPVVPGATRPAPAK